MTDPAYTVTFSEEQLYDLLDVLDFVEETITSHLDSLTFSNDEKMGRIVTLFDAKNTYCCHYGSDGEILNCNQFEAYSWRAPLACIQHALGRGYNSGSVSRGECEDCLRD